MLLNFCDPCLRTDIQCSTVSTEGYEPVNLVNNSDKGFLAYACIKPPIHLDFVFICNVKLSHIILWPCVGSQKSSGFLLSVKSSGSNQESFFDVSTAFLKNNESGVFFHRREIVDVSAPLNFLPRYMKASRIVDFVSTLRLKIMKTENSVPAIGRIEIWGTVSPKCGKDVAGNVAALWSNQHDNVPVASSTLLNVEKLNNEENNDCDQQLHANLNIPEDFLDPITLEIMTQPIILPSGKIIDQKTLEKHANNEAVWGRPVSDPFTGVRFSANKKPIAAFPLKARIDMFLLQNSDKEEIKQLPRVLGTSAGMPKSTNVRIISCKPVNDQSKNSDSSARKRTVSSCSTDNSVVKKPFYGHKLPIIPIRCANVNRKTSVKSSSGLVNTNSKRTNEEIQKNNSAIEEKMNEKISISSMLNCQCCVEKIFYKLPCDHVICRKALISLEIKQCSICKTDFQSSDPQRCHL